MSEKPDHDGLSVNAKRRRVLRAAQEDGRTQQAKRRRAIEKLIRDELERRGRSISFLDEMHITSLARAQLQLEIAGALASRGQAIGDEATRWANIASRAMGALGLTPASLKPRVSLRQHLRGRAGVVAPDQVPR
jgi:hypothetical protein